MAPTKRPASLPLPDYGKKQSDFASKKAWQSARAREAGYKSYADWLKTRREEGVKRTNLGRASETYKARKASGFTEVKKEKIKTAKGKVLGTRYFFNIKKDGWAPLITFLSSLDPQANVILTVKTSNGRYLNYNSRQNVGQFYLPSLPSNFERLFKEQSPKRKNKGAKKEERVIGVIVDVFL